MGPFGKGMINSSGRMLLDTLHKHPGEDQINVELIKYGPQELCEGIADILNKTASTGKYPDEIKRGILIPLPKPGKKAGPPPT